MKVNLSNFERADRNLFDVSIIQNEIGGGTTEKEQLECIKEYPGAKSLIVSGLNQESFEYLIKHFGNQFEAISFWKNKLICDLSPLSDLNNNNWRVGIPEEKTALVTNGIYKWSRNPAFVGFDLLYLSMCLLFFNIPLLIVSVWTAVMLHLQILQEENYMRKIFGEDYITYMKHTFRYLRRKSETG